MHPAVAIGAVTLLETFSIEQAKVLIQSPRWKDIEIMDDEDHSTRAVLPLQPDGICLGKQPLRMIDHFVLQRVVDATAYREIQES